MLIDDPIIDVGTRCSFGPNKRAISTLLHAGFLGDEDVCSAGQSFSLECRMA